MPIKNKTTLFFLIVTLFSLSACYINQQEKATDLRLDKDAYQKKLQGFWLGQCIGNWTGLVTEMDKIGNVGPIKTGAFYTREDWGTPDQPNIWSAGVASDLSTTIDFVLRDTSQIWGADDDTDIEYMYLYLLHSLGTTHLSGAQIRAGWLSHIHEKEENFLWVSNQRAFDLMLEGVLPPNTSNPDLNEHTEMIDAQLTTEIFGLLAPGRPDIALDLAKLPIQTTARHEAEEIARFYVVMHALAAHQLHPTDVKSYVHNLALEARKFLQPKRYPARMFDFVWAMYQQDFTWEETRDSIYQRYQVQQQDGYNITEQNLHCNGCFAAGINYAASLVSLFYGEGDLKETLKIGTLAGWDSDNPTATWGGLLGFIYGIDYVESIFGGSLSHQFNIHRTRKGFPNNGLDNFDNMAQMGLDVIDMVVTQDMKGQIDTTQNLWVIPL